MKIAVFSDIHFHPFPTFAKVGADGLNSRLQHTFDRARDIVRIAREQECDAILFGGDLFHTKKIDAETIDIAERAFADCRIPIIGVPGNHDMATFGPGARHSARALSKHIRWLDGTDQYGRSADITIYASQSNQQTVKVWGIPYVHDKNLLLQELDKVPKGTDILLMHCGFAGGFMGSDYIADLGDCIDYFSCNGKADLVVSGHFHQPQLITWNEKGDVKNDRPSANGPQFGRWEKGRGILVPGSPEQHTWGDKGSARGFWIVDVTERKAHFQHLMSPEFVEIDKDWMSTGASMKHNQYVRVIGTPSDADLTELKMCTPHLVIEAAPTSITRPQRSFEVAVGDAPGALVQKYVAASGTPLDQERLIKEGKRLLGCN